jgi:hypothetical protein
MSKPYPGRLANSELRSGRGPILRAVLGYLALAFAILGLVLHVFGYAVILILSLAALVCFLVAAPLWCGAETHRGLRCRNNSHGLLLGCHLREHKWQRLKDALVSRRWRNAVHDLLGLPREILATPGGLASVVSLIFAPASIE